MRKQPVRLGWLSLLLAVSMVCLAVLSVLAFATARASSALAKRQAQAVTELYALENEGQQWLAAADAAARAGTLPDGVQEKTFTSGSRILDAAVQVQNGRCTVVRWRHSAVWTEPAPAQNLWGG